MSIKLLIVEDNVQIMGTLVDYLELDDYQIDCAYHGEAALTFCSQNTYDIMIVDIMMPKLDGIAFVSQLRQNLGWQGPVLFLTAKDSLEDKTRAFQAGGDDYLVKPFALEELQLRLSALLKRGAHKADNSLQFHDLRLERNPLALFWKDRPVKLAPKQLKIVEKLLQKAPNVVTRSELIEYLWGDEPPKSDALRSHLYAIRTALSDANGSLLKTVHSQGFCLVPTTQPHD